MAIFYSKLSDKGTIRSYYVNSKLHAAKFPAVKSARKDEWWFYGQRHRISSGPAVTTWFDSERVLIAEEEYYEHSQLHREDGPAVIGYYTTGELRHEIYYYRNELHRLDGPSMISYDKGGNCTDCSWCVHGIAMIEENHQETLLFQGLSKPDILRLRLEYGDVIPGREPQYRNARSQKI